MVGVVEFYEVQEVMLLVRMGGGRMGEDFVGSWIRVGRPVVGIIGRIRIGRSCVGAEEVKGSNGESAELRSHFCGAGREGGALYELRGETWGGVL